MKKILAAAMAMAMVLSLAACGNSGDGGNSATSGNNQSNTSSSQAGGSQTTDVSDFKVGAIYINSKNDTAGYTYAHHNGITKAMEALGMDPDTQLIIQDEITEDYENVATAVDTLVGEDCDIIFGISFGYLNAMADKAEEYPDVIFSHATGYMSNPNNYNNYFGRIYQARYLAGIAAGLKSLETNNNNVGYVSAYGTEYAETCSGINGFALGVQAVNPDATVYVKELGNWFDEVNEYAFAEELINSYNCGVIAQHCDSAQPQLAAEKAGVFGCGYNSDMTKDAPNAHLTAPVWNWDVYYKLAIETAMACEGDASQFVEKMGGEAWYGGLAEGFVDVSPLSDNCAAGTQDAIDQVRELIVSGAWDVFSGVKLKVTVADGKAAVEQYDDALVTSDRDETKDGQVVVPANTEIVPAGGESVEDGVITGTMNYFVKGVVVA
ncbi:Purine-binding protein BAB2_0673 precursor [uncultured Flavonifractor sp.]|uniref:BMP family ABC transporter substrate-binding protein n=1 Tax=Flintibacter hominis TaxID=2763048 RepID=A0A8J6M721_9FIRM|nr:MULTISPECIES: BMP family ABC transporter substrate-binding protein [Eubacteriales]SCH39430.1 Purine-binding protein BAB2_0673 precursor [uncultured Clostridium sp.]SCI68385.1 Purine-binding protein BAB2_0673 precursor [uncultured Flavonifractor sp.]MBC5723384.1 BMP family ABC transporter substrate-binding protein [Flintibacter hominis]MCH1980853.1 BMP family ABC transporter substrate-binding protein [Lawsonibacter sp. OA9]MCU6702398.1 BMP family ABC transporter substrate-binding protein [Mu